MAQTGHLYYHSLQEFHFHEVLVICYQLLSPTGKMNQRRLAYALHSAFLLL